MKALIGDKIAVMKTHPDTDSKYMAMVGVLTALDRGRKTEDKRAHSEEGEVTEETEVEAKGWAIVTTDDGKRISVPTKAVVVHSQKVVLEHNATMAMVTKVSEARAERDATLEKARALCTEKGLDATTLSPDNLLRLATLLA